MWTITCDDGREISEADCLWPNLPPDLKIVSLYAAGLTLVGCSDYGFQRYAVSAVDGRVLDHGLQLLGRRADGSAVVIDCHFSHGARVALMPAADITYHPELWRRG